MNAPLQARPENAPRVSVVMASYRHEAFVGRMVDSILAQTFSDFELVVVDDGSPDATARIVAERAAGDPRVTLEVGSNRGVVAARNRGLELARGEFVAIVDSDDLLPPDRLERQVRALAERPEAALAWGDAWMIDESDRPFARFSRLYPPVEGDFSTALFCNHCFVPAASVMFRREAFERSGPLREPGPSTDYLKWIELGLFGEAIRVPGEPLGCWRKHATNTSRAAVERRIGLYESLREGLRALRESRPELALRVSEERARRRYGFCRFMAGFHAMAEGRADLARERFRLACEDDPSPRNRLALASTLPGLRAPASAACRILRRAKFGAAA